MLHVEDHLLACPPGVETLSRLRSRYVRELRCKLWVREDELGDKQWEISDLAAISGNLVP